MTLAIKQFFMIARLTALDAIRQPLAFLLFASTLILIALLPLVLSHTLGESVKFVRDGSLGFMFVAGLILGAHIACASITNEVRHGTVSVVLSKPIARTTFFLAKYAGIATVLLLFSAGITMAVMLSVRTAFDAYVTDWWSAAPLLLACAAAFVLGGLSNYFLRRSFVSNAFITLLLLLTLAFIFAGFVDQQGNAMSFGALYDFRILPAATLIALAILVLAGLSVSLATRFSTIPTLSICGGIFFIGLLSDYYFGRHAETSQLAKALYYVFPNWQHFWVVDALGGDGSIPLEYVLLAGAYAAVYLAGILMFGLLAFQRMEVEA